MMFCVDGDALLRSFAEAEDALAAGDRQTTRDNVTRWLGRYCELRSADAVLFFLLQEEDGVVQPTRWFGRLRVSNLAAGSDKRREIGQAVRRAPAGDEVTVVSDDWRVDEVLRGGRARVLAPAQFVAQARTTMGSRDEAVADEPDEKFTGVADEEVALWMDFFEEDQ